MKVFTKGEIIRFLEPFDDDIKVLVEQDMGLVDHADLRYFVNPVKAREIANFDEVVKAGVAADEAFILI